MKIRFMIDEFEYDFDALPEMTKEEVLTYLPKTAKAIQNLDRVNENGKAEDALTR